MTRGWEQSGLHDALMSHQTWKSAKDMGWPNGTHVGPDSHGGTQECQTLKFRNSNFDAQWKLLNSYIISFIKN